MHSCASCSVGGRYPRGRRRRCREAAAAARTQGKKTLVFSLFFSAARASDFVKYTSGVFFWG